MDRRQFLMVAGSVGVAGCGSTGSDTDGAGGATTGGTTTDRTTARRAEGTEGSTGDEPAGTDQSGGDTIYVAADSRGGTGSDADPLGSIQAAFDVARPGDTIHVRPGEYREAVRTRRDGTAEDPITLTGPPDAVFRGDSLNDKPWSGFHFEHSHVHIRGLTFDGLSDPANPDAPESYVDTIIVSWLTPGSSGEYHRDLVIKPHAVGNTLRPAIYVAYSRQVEIGEFEVIGPAGLAMLEFGDEESHNGEVVYLGHAPDQLDDSITAAQFDGEPDRTRDVHVHHIDNSAGHPHAELVDVKAGCSDVLIEYCTDAGGAGRYVLPGGDPTSETSMHLGGRNITLRWNVIEGSHGQGVEVGSYGLAQPEDFEDQYGMAFPEDLLDHGRANEIYGNRIVDCAGLAIQYPTVYADGTERIVEGYGPENQTRVCGNEITGETHGVPHEWVRWRGSDGRHHRPPGRRQPVVGVGFGVAGPAESPPPRRLAALGPATVPTDDGHSTRSTNRVQSLGPGVHSTIDVLGEMLALSTVVEARLGAGSVSNRGCPRDRRDRRTRDRWVPM